MGKFNLEDLGLNNQYIKEAEMYGKDLYIARVSAQFKDLYKIITENGEISAQISGKLNYLSNSSFDYPAVGDWVLADRNDDRNGNAIIHRILTRRSYFQRKAAGKVFESQIIASNIDTVFICMSLNNDFNIRRLERYISIAWNSMATPVIILTKSDLCDNVKGKLFETESVAIGIDILAVNSMSDDGYKAIKKYIVKGKTTAFIGSSGVGKSTLINKLIGTDFLNTNEVRESDDHGRHTTTNRQLIVLPEGGVVIDTPGMRELGVISADLDTTFSDIKELAKNCKFNDCKHENEPYCAVLKAIEDGRLDNERFENYKKLQKELSYSELNSRQLEKEKINNMFGSLNAMKEAMRYVKNKNK